MKISYSGTVAGLREYLKMKKAIEKMWTPQPDKADRRFAIITNGGGWHDDKKPSSTINLLGFFDGMGNIVESNEELLNLYNRELKKCGEFADDLVQKGEIDYIFLKNK